MFTSSLPAVEHQPKFLPPPKLYKSFPRKYHPHSPPRLQTPFKFQHLTLMRPPRPPTHLLPFLRKMSSSQTQPNQKLRIGFIPEHFSTPLHFAQLHHHLPGTLVPEPLGTGALTRRLKLPDSDPEALDIAVGLTEGFVADLGKGKASSSEGEVGYRLVGTYVQSPLCWAISTGAQRGELKGVEDLRGKRVGVSRVGSGSYVMSFVLADQKGWLQQSTSTTTPASSNKQGEGGGGEGPFGIVVAGDFASLRAAVSKEQGAEGGADFFMWEHFTTKHYWDTGELKRLGDIYTPWPSWMIAARSSLTSSNPALLDEVLASIDKGVQFYHEFGDQAVEWITETMQYSAQDARAWMRTVRFADGVRGVEGRVVDETVGLLRKAGVLGQESGGSEGMIAIKRA